VTLASGRITLLDAGHGEVVVIGRRAAGLIRRAWLGLRAGDGSSIVASPPHLWRPLLSWVAPTLQPPVCPPVLPA
jgi:hypothetical protein